MMKGNLYIFKEQLLTYEINYLRHTTNEAKHY